MTSFQNYMWLCISSSSKIAKASKCHADSYLLLIIIFALYFRHCILCRDRLKAAQT